MPDPLSDAVAVAKALSPARVYRFSRAAVSTSYTAAVVGAKTVDVLAKAVEDGSLERAVSVLGKLPEIIEILETLPNALDTLAVIPEALGKISDLPAVINDLSAEIRVIPGRLDQLIKIAIPTLGQLANVLPSLGDTTRLLADLGPVVDASRSVLGVLGAGDLPDQLELAIQELPGLVDQGRALAEWVVAELAPQRSILPELLRRVQGEVLPLVSTLSGTGDDVVALRGAVERLVGVLDGVQSQLGTLPGAAMIRRRAESAAQKAAGSAKAITGSR